MSAPINLGGKKGEGWGWARVATRANVGRKPTKEPEHFGKRAAWRQSWGCRTGKRNQLSLSSPCSLHTGMLLESSSMNIDLHFFGFRSVIPTPTLTPKAPATKLLTVLSSAQVTWDLKKSHFSEFRWGEWLGGILETQCISVSSPEKLSQEDMIDRWEMDK